jgi:hypothetical protein
MDERATVAAQLGRMPRAFRRVVVTCPHGLPAVTEQDPYGPDGEPFPTTYYVTCRHLVAAVSRLEAAGGVERWSRRLATDPELREDLERATAEQAQIRVSLADGAVGRDDGASLTSGIGGSRNSGQLKCLHAHVAYALANPGYRLGEEVLAEIPEPWPSRCCSVSVAGVEPAVARPLPAPR